MTALYQLSESKLQALQIIDDMINEGCSDAEMQEAYALLNQLDENFQEKAVNVAMYARNLEAEAEAEAISEATKEMVKRYRSITAKADRLRSYLLSEMQRTQTKQIKCPYFVLSLRKIPASVRIAPNAVIPDFLLAPPKPQEFDKRAIKEAIEKGFVIEGVTLESGETLSIK